MKSGASDPFADDEPAQPETTQTESATKDDDSEDDSATAESERTTATDSTASSSEQTSDSQETDVSGLSRDELPFILRREKVKDERPEVHQLFVQSGTHDQAVDAERELEDMLGVDLSRTDAREAIYLAGMANLDEAATVLRRWGYDM